MDKLFYGIDKALDKYGEMKDRFDPDDYNYLNGYLHGLLVILESIDDDRRDSYVETIEKIRV